MKKLAACAALCGVLVGCEHKHTNLPVFALGESVLIHGTIQGQVIDHTHWIPGCAWSYQVLLEKGTVVNFKASAISPKNEDMK